MKQWLIDWGYWIAFGGAVVATIGDFGQLWVVNSGRADLLLIAPPENTIVFATLAGALGIPLYGLGYYVRARQALGRKPNSASMLALTGAAFSVVGGIVHGATGITIASESGEIASGLPPMEGIMAAGPIVLSLWGLATACFLAAGIVELTLAQKHLDRLFNPLFLTIVLSIAAAGLVSPLNDFVGPAAFNIAHILFFARLAIVRRN